MEKELLLSARKVCKSFGPTRALIDVDVQISAGEIRGLIGENGSGKSTFSSIISGSQKADSGSFELKGHSYFPVNMVDAQNQGVSMIVQEMGTIGRISVAENIFAGRLEEYSKLGIVNKKEIFKKSKEILKDIGVSDIDVEARTMSLNFEDRKIIEIARAMVSNPDILIIDETTTALAHKGRTILYNLIKRMHEHNKAVLFISHDLEELMEVCNSITVLRDGVIIDTLNRNEMNVDKMRTLMVGRELTGDYFRGDFDGSFEQDVLLEMKRVTYGQIENLDIQLHKGEILGIGGLSNCGMHEIGRLLFGIEKPLTGEVMLHPSKIEVKNPVIAVANNMAYVSKDRDREAIILNASVQENLEIPSYKRLTGTLGHIKKIDEEALSNEQIEEMQIKCRNARQNCKELSGGNKQKVVFAKWLAKESDIYILDCPTRGIDVGVKAAMYKLMMKLKKQGKGIVLISEELLELIGMSDRILVFKDGKLTAELNRNEDVSEQSIIPYII